MCFNKNNKNTQLYFQEAFGLNFFCKKNRFKWVRIYLFTKFAAEYNVSGCLSPFLWKIISVCYSVMHIGT